MNISKDLINKLSDELITQEVNRLVNLKRNEISKSANVEVEKFFIKSNLQAKIKKMVVSQSSLVEKNLEREVNNYFKEYDFANAIDEYIDSNAGYKVIDGIVKEILARGIK